jgi:hypothetical protein
MPLRDHFHEPLSPSRLWQGFHNAWATAIAWDLNRRLPEPYVAEPNVRFGIEVDVAALEGTSALREGTARRSDAQRDAVAGAAAWVPPSPTLTVPFGLTTDIVEVVIHNTEGGTTLVGAIEIVSPANKDRAAHREVFTSKCKAYLQEGIGLSVIDIVTSRRANLHAALLDDRSAAAQDLLYAAAYHPRERGGETELEVWLERLDLGKSLPTLPLWIRGGPCVPVDFDRTYETACEGLRIP